MENSQIFSMRKLGMTEEEIADILKTDKEIDQGVKHFELTAEQKKAEKKMRQAERKPTIYQLDNTGGKRSKKADNDKSYLLEMIQKGLAEFADIYANNITVINPEREFEFNFNGRKFKITLSAPRK